MTRDSDKILNEIVERIKKIDPFKIILFGSYASGNPDNDSDIDLIVITDEDYIQSMEVEAQIYQIIYDDINFF